MSFRSFRSFHVDEIVVVCGTVFTGRIKQCLPFPDGELRYIVHTLDFMTKPGPYKQNELKPASSAQTKIHHELANDGQPRSDATIHLIQHVVMYFTIYPTSNWTPTNLMNWAKSKTLIPTGSSKKPINRVLNLLVKLGVVVRVRRDNNEPTYHLAEGVEGVEGDTEDTEYTKVGPPSPTAFTPHDITSAFEARKCSQIITEAQETFEFLRQLVKKRWDGHYAEVKERDTEIGLAHQDFPGEALDKALDWIRTRGFHVEEELRDEEHVWAFSLA